jgi:hypothetical protein
LAVVGEDVTFTLPSDAGLTLALQRSIDLQTWHEFLTVTHTNGVYPVRDTDAVQVFYRFYRAVGRLP